MLVLFFFMQAKQLQSRRDTIQVLQGCQERSQQRFPLKDLLNVPIQRFLKYPLLIKVGIHCYHVAEGSRSQ